MSTLRIALVLAATLCVAAAAATPAAAALPASGQKKCWSAAGAKLPCAGTGQDGEAQAGASLALRDNGDGTLVDVSTGLLWEKLSRDGSIHDRDALYTWEQAVAAKIAALNTPPCFASHCGWRMPNVKELQSIVDFGRRSPALARPFSKRCTAGCDGLGCSCTPVVPTGAPGGFWSSTTNVAVPAEAWQLLHASGDTASLPKSGTGTVRAVTTPVCSKAIVTASLAFAAGSGQPVSGATVEVDYPEAKVEIPGTGSQVAGIRNLTGVAGGLFSFGDSDGLVSVGLVSLSQAIPAGPFAEIELECLDGQAPPFLYELGCAPTVSDFLGADVPSLCSLAIAYE